MEDSKRCKQCGKLKTISSFMKYPSRGKGLRSTGTGYYTVCNECVKLASYVKAMIDEQGGPDPKEVELVRAIFKQPGWKPVLKPIRQLLGLYVEDNKNRSRVDKLADFLTATILDEHGMPVYDYSSVTAEQEKDAQDVFVRIKNRDFVDTGDAWDALRDVDLAIRKLGLFEEADAMIEAWEDEE